MKQVFDIRTENVLKRTVIDDSGNKTVFTYKLEGPVAGDCPSYVLRPDSHPSEKKIDPLFIEAVRRYVKEKP